MRPAYSPGSRCAGVYSVRSPALISAPPRPAGRCPPPGWIPLRNGFAPYKISFPRFSGGSPGAKRRGWGCFGSPEGSPCGGARRGHAAPSPQPPPPEGRGSIGAETPHRCRRTGAIPTSYPPPLGGGAGGGVSLGRLRRRPFWLCPTFAEESAEEGEVSCGARIGKTGQPSVFPAHSPETDRERTRNGKRIIILSCRIMRRNRQDVPDRRCPAKPGGARRCPKRRGAAAGRPGNFFSKDGTVCPDRGTGPNSCFSGPFAGIEY